MRTCHDSERSPAEKLNERYFSAEGEVQRGDVVVVYEAVVEPRVECRVGLFRAGQDRDRCVLVAVVAVVAGFELEPVGELVGVVDLGFPDVGVDALDFLLVYGFNAAVLEGLLLVVACPHRASPAVE